MSSGILDAADLLLKKIAFLCPVDVTVETKEYRDYYVCFIKNANLQTHSHDHFEGLASCCRNG
jgi:hypothetical protein